jgi:hypothetical protein
MGLSIFEWLVKRVFGAGQSPISLFEPGKFVAIRMIVVNPNPNPDFIYSGGDFETWMKNDFLDAMGGLFKPNGWLWLNQGDCCPELKKYPDSGLERIIFLKGNIKDTRQSHQGAGTNRTCSTAAGANANYAWVTLWTSREANQAAWSCSCRPTEWHNDVPGSDRGYWNRFLSWCLPKPERPWHGPAYDYIGAPGYLFWEDGHIVKHVGRGAGCLTEGFEIIYSKSDWPVWPSPPSQS